MIDLTNQMIFRLGNLNTEQTRISYQMSTGKKIDRGSDDSSVFSRELYVNDKIRTYEGLQTQIEKTQAQNNVSDSAIGEMKKLMDNIKQEMMKALNSGTDASDKISIATSIEGMKENLLTLANERVDGEYLFTGSDTTVRPFSKDPVTGEVTYNGDDSLRKVAVQPNTYRERGVTGFDVMFYNKDIGSIDDDLNFTQQERIIDQNGVEWHMSEATEGHKLTFDIDDVIQNKTVPEVEVPAVAPVLGNTWVLSEATVGHKLTFDLSTDGSSGDIVDDNGDIWKVDNPAAPTMLVNQTTPALTINVTQVGAAPSDIYETTSDIPDNLGITKLSIGDLRLREISINPALLPLPGANDMQGNSIAVTNINGDQYRTAEITSNDTDQLGNPVDSFTTTGMGILTLRHVDDEGEIVTADTKLATVAPEVVDPDTGLNIREYTVSKTAFSVGEVFDAKHNFFDDIDTIVNALNTDTNDTKDPKNGPVGIRDMLSVVEKSYDAMNVAHSTLGARNKTFEISLDSITASLTHFNILSLEVSTVDFAQVAMESKALEMTYTALYSTITKLNSLSLVNFIK